ncbi:MAG: ABC transporter ATP-binding protein [Lachnospiraceae bacterium]|nr:ABC transporter ATP-binding protein [Lachnospiraceae bacterium]
MLKVTNLKKKYGRKQVLKGINMEVATGSIYGFVGQNGAGKTTTMRIITGLLAADSGMVEFEGVDLLKKSKLIADIVGYVPDYFGVYNKLRVLEYMEFFALLYGISANKARKKSRDMLEMMGLEHVANQYVDELSRGMKQRICMARTLLSDPKLLVLDEPTSGMDPQSRIEFKRLLKELSAQGKSIIISSHILPDLSEICDSIGIIDEGRMLYEGKMDGVSTDVNISNPLGIRVIENRDEAIRCINESSLAQSIAIDGNDIQVAFLGDNKSEAELLEKMIANGVRVTFFGRKRDNLEDVFMRLTEQEDERSKRNRV